jgi:hypothetical protein
MAATYDRCSRCDKFAWLGWSGTHNCIAYRVKVLERIDESYPGDKNAQIEDHSQGDWESKVYATEPRLAAEIFAQRYDQNGEYDIVNGDYKLRLLVFQSDPSEAGAKEFIVQGWSQPVYDASEQKERKYSFPAEEEDEDEEEEEDAAISC